MQPSNQSTPIAAAVRLYVPEVRRGLVAGSVAGAASGAPSIFLSVVRGNNLLASSRAAGTLLGKPSVLRGLCAHTVLSLFWGVVLSLCLPRRERLVQAGVAGLGIAALDLGIVGRHYPLIRALPQVDQVLDHFAFGLVVGLVLARLETEEAPD